VRCLLSHGASIDTMCRDGSALHVAVEYGALSTVELLLSAGADVNLSHAELGTPLQVASNFGNSEAVELLLLHGAGINAREGRVFGTALYQADEGSSSWQCDDEDAVRRYAKLAEILRSRGGISLPPVDMLDDGEDIGVEGYISEDYGDD